MLFFHNSVRHGPVQGWYSTIAHLMLYYINVSDFYQYITYSKYEAANTYETCNACKMWCDALTYYIFI